MKTYIAILLFKLTCFTLTGRMIYVQFHDYVENEDSSSVSYKTFNDDKDEAHPTFSICVAGEDGEIFKESLKTSYKSYFNYLVGEETNASILRDLLFDEVAINTLPVEKSYTKTKEWEVKNVFGKNIDINHWKENFYRYFVITHQDPWQVCFTKRENEEEGIQVQFEFLSLDANWILENNLRIYFYVHQKRQLIRSIIHPKFIFLPKSLLQLNQTYQGEYRKDILLDGQAIDVLKKRPDAKKKCNNTFFDDDRKWIEGVMGALKCIPEFMTRFISNSTSNVKLHSLSTCNQTKHREYAMVYYPEAYCKRISNSYLDPCTQVSTVVTSSELTAKNDLNGSASSLLNFWLTYNTQAYKETQNKKAFDMATLWGQIGGFVGIFLGYSLLQVPDLCCDFVAWIKQHLENRNSHYERSCFTLFKKPQNPVRIINCDNGDSLSGSFTVQVNSKLKN